MISTTRMRKEIERINQITTENTELKNKVKVLEVENAELKTKLTALKIKVDIAEADINKLKDDISKIKEKNGNKNLY